MQLASAAAKRPLPRPPLLSPHHQIIAKYLLMFFFHPSKRWSPACSRAPSWFCCVWRQCSASEPSEVKGGHKGRQEGGPASRRGPPLTPTPANLPPTGGRGGDPRPVPLSLRCSGAAPSTPSRPGEQREEDVTLMSARGGRGCFMCKASGGGGGGGRLFNSPNLHQNFIFLNTLAARDVSPRGTRAGPRASSHHHPKPACSCPGAGLGCLQPPFAFTLRACAPSFQVYF